MSLRVPNRCHSMYGAPGKNDRNLRAAQKVVMDASEDAVGCLGFDLDGCHGCSPCRGGDGGVAAAQSPGALTPPRGGGTRRLPLPSSPVRPRGCPAKELPHAPPACLARP